MVEIHPRRYLIEIRDAKGSVLFSAAAHCRADGRDLGADMVSDGHAWAFVRYSRDYVEQEREAAAVRAGIHGHTCEPAWQWRSERRKN
jgi:endonuclease YncB( thermonuclease family)